MKKLIVIFMVVFLLSSMLCITALAANGDNKSNAIIINQYDKVYYGTLSSEGTNDWYKLTTDSQEAYYYFTLNNETGTANAHIVVYNDRDVEMLDVGYYTGKGQTAVGNVKLEPNSTYYLKVHMNDEGVGNYSIKVSKKIDEISNEQQRATSINKDTMYYQSIDGNGDLDWYTISSDSQNAYYYFYLKNESGTENAHLIVYNERDVELINVGYYTSAGQEITGNIKLEPNAKYYLKVYFNDAGTGNYAFQVTSSVDEIGNDKNSALEIQTNKVVSSSIDGNGDVDYFVLKTGSSTREYQLIYNNETGTTNGHVVVYSDRDEELINVGSYTGAGQSADGTVTLKANSTYYFKAYLNDDGVGSYSFKLSQCVEGHTPSGVWSTTVEPTCFTNGEKCQSCSVCGEVVETQEIEALGHDFSNKETVKEATLISLGEKKATCSRCGEVEYSKDWSKVWILPVIIVGGILVLIGIINYARAFSKSKRGRY